MLLHPVAIAAAVTLLLNDHVLKDAFPGFVTGKLSDVAGLVFFPLLLAELTALLLRRNPARLLPAAAALTALVFTLVKITPAGAAAYAWALGAAQWMVALALTGHADLRPVVVVMDQTDLLAVPAVLVDLAIAGRPRRSAFPSRLVSRFAHSRLAPIGMGVLMAAATMARRPHADRRLPAGPQPEPERQLDGKGWKPDRPDLEA